MRRKVYAAVIAATLAVGMMGTSVMAETTASGETTFEYKTGGVGPIEPVDPGTEETSVNNWMVYFPKLVTLTDSNVATADTFTKGTDVTFTVKQKQPGTDGDEIKLDNIPSGITVEANVPNEEGNFPLTGSAGSATMQRGTCTTPHTVVTQTNNELGILKDGAGATQSGKAKISDNSGVVDGTTYSTNVIFTFTNPADESTV